LLSDNFVMVGDPHFGIKNDHSHWLQRMLNYWSENIFPYARTNGVKQILIMGDFFDRRRFANFETLEKMLNVFSPVTDEFEIYCLVGNHDIYWRDSLSVIGPKLTEFGNLFNWVVEPEIHGHKILVPWITKENKDSILKLLSTHSDKPSTDVFGHFESTGFEVVPGIPSHGNVSPALFKDYRNVYSGHFHQRQKNGNMFYVGTPYELNRSDRGTAKGFFHYVDGSLREIPNPNPWFIRIDWKDGMSIADFTPSQITGNDVDVFVGIERDPVHFEEFVKALENLSPLSLSVNTIVTHRSEMLDLSVLASIEDNLTLLNVYVDEMVKNPDQQKNTKTLIADLYQRASTDDE